MKDRNAKVMLKRRHCTGRVKEERREGQSSRTHACNLATHEKEIRRIEVQSQPGQIVHEALSQKYATQKGAGRVA
jgi:hypothetical protein